MAYGGYTNLENEILYNQNLSAQAKILYMVFLNHSTIPNFVIRKATIMKASGLKGNTFDKYLRELKNNGLIEVHGIRNGKKYEYHYTVVRSEKSERNRETQKVEKTAEEKVVEATQCTVEEAREAIELSASNENTKKIVPYAIGIIRNNRISKKAFSVSTKKNSFHNFPERQYTKEYFENIERLLLEKNYFE